MGHTSIQRKIMFWGGLCLVLAATAIIGYAAVSLRNSELRAAQERAIALAEAKATYIDAEVEVSLDTARALAHALSAVKAEQNALTVTRAEVNTILFQVLVNNPAFLGTYTLWEPHAFDRLDARYANTPGHDSTGRFIPYWNRNQTSRITLEPSLDYEQAGIGDYYLCPRNTLNECVIDPFIYPVQGEAVLMTSVVVPIIHDGQFYGITGVDLRLDDFQQMADSFNLYDGTATVALISFDGTLAAVTGQPELLGKPGAALHGPDFLAEDLLRIQNGEPFDEIETYQGANIWKSLRPSALVAQPRPGHSTFSFPPTS